MQLFLNYVQGRVVFTAYLGTGPHMSKFSNCSQPSKVTASLLSTTSSKDEMECLLLKVRCLDKIGYLC